MRAIDLTPTELFIGTTAQPEQVLRVAVTGLVGQARITVTGEGVSGSALTSEEVTEVGLNLDAPAGSVVALQVHVTDDESSLTATADVTVAEPGWTMYLISHFHYDPVWWATQAAYAVTWNTADEMASKYRMKWQQPGFALIETHLDLARRDPDYKFVLAEVDLLKPFWDARPDRRAYLRQLVAEGRLELLGGTYNEPNTNLTSAEVTIRNFVYGAGFQREIFGADPATAWQLDAFGHDPQFPGLAADAGVSSSSWARGPFRPWGPMLKAFLPGAEGWGDPATMQFASEFEWIAPSGKGLLTHYMPAHYSAGWVMDEASTLAEAEAALYELFCKLKTVAATRNVLLPVGTDYTPPNKWVTDVHRDWNSRYVWPRFVCAVPAEFFAAVRAELDADGRTLSPQTRDMNPIFTGKEVSYIDTKQAHRAAETALVDAEKFAVFARSYGGAYPHVAFDKAWRHLIFGAHHDGVTGSESDQVYLDLLTNWREALDLANSALDDSLGLLASLIRGSGDEWAVTVFNPSSWQRSDVVELTAELPVAAMNGCRVLDEAGVEVPALVSVAERHPDDTLKSIAITLIAEGVPALGYRSWRLVPAPITAPSGWSDLLESGTSSPDTISSERYLLQVNPARGGCVSRLLDRRHDRELIAAGSVGNALLRTHEYAEHPTFNEGPWHLLPTGDTTSSAELPADRVQVQSSALGQRIIVNGSVDGVDYCQTLTLFNGVDRVDCRTELHGYSGADQLFRIQWPAVIAGAMPVSEVGNAVIGRGHALIDVDSADHPWTLDNPAYGFFALSSTVKVRVASGSAEQFQRAVNTAEIVSAGQDCRELAVALVRAGVTATTSVATGPRYGNLAVDSNLPDFRISVGTATENPFTAAVLADAPEHAADFEHQLSTSGSARVWVPAVESLAKVWQPSADLRALTCLPVLLIAGPRAVSELAADLDDAVIEVNQTSPAGDGGPGLDDFTFAILNRGTPGFAVDTDGALHMSLMRSCTGWPSGVWIDPPARTAPDGSTFQQQHWSHSFDYAVASGAGDWRQADLVPAAHDFNHRLLARAHLADGDVLGAEMSFLQLHSDGAVVVTAVKATGNALADGRVAVDDDAVTIRFYEAKGQPTSVSLSSPAGLSGVHSLDLLERAVHPASSGPIAVNAGDVITVGATLAAAADLSGPPVEQYAEPVQPIYSQYWLNNTGTAPAGNVPVAVHFASSGLDISAGGHVPVSVTVASTLQEVPAEGTVTLVVPAGWTISPTSRDYALGPGAQLQLDAQLTAPADAASGCYFIAAEIAHGDQRIHDLCRVFVGGAGPEQIEAELSSTGLHLSPGRPDSLSVTLTTDAASDLPAQVQLISPPDIWPLVADWNSGAVLPARGSATLDFPIRVPIGTPAGAWWVIVKIAAASRVRFTEAIEFTVLPS